jgi:hypothetical protein
VGNLTDNPKELYEALAWKRDNSDCGGKWRADKVASLCEWYETHGMFTEKQIDFGNSLLQGD